MKKILITGGAGFIASHVSDAYIAAGHSVAIIDNLTTGFRKNLPKKARFYRADIRNLEAIEKIFKKERPEVVNHHAAIVEVVKSIRDPLSTLTTNVLGTANVLLAFGVHGAGSRKKFIFASTGGAMYGSPRINPVNETTPPSPLSPYALSKLLGEHVIKYYASQYGFSYLILRYANVYGPRQNPHGEAGVVAIFGGLMKSGKQPTIFGDGTKARDYVYALDVARANTIALTRGINETVNLGTGKKTTDDMIFYAAAEATGYIGKPHYAPYRKGEVYQITLDARKAEKVLGWTPKMKLQEGIRKTLAEL